MCPVHEPVHINLKFHRDAFALTMPPLEWYPVPPFIIEPILFVKESETDVSDNPRVGSRVLLRNRIWRVLEVGWCNVLRLQTISTTRGTEECSVNYVPEEWCYSPHMNVWKLRIRYMDKVVIAGSTTEKVVLVGGPSAGKIVEVQCTLNDFFIPTYSLDYIAASASSSVPPYSTMTEAQYRRHTFTVGTQTHAVFGFIGFRKSFPQTNDTLVFEGGTYKVAEVSPFGGVWKVFAKRVSDTDDVRLTVDVDRVQYVVRSDRWEVKNGTIVYLTGTCQRTAK